MRRIAILTVLGALLAPSAAHASNFPHMAQATHVQADALFRSAVADADNWWVKATGHRPPSMHLYVYDKDDGAAAYAELCGATVRLSRQYRDDVWRYVNSGANSFDDRVFALTRLWVVAAHERGHNLCMRHQTEGCPSNLMCEDAGNASPWEATRWARRKLRDLRIAAGKWLDSSR